MASRSTSRYQRKYPVATLAAAVAWDPMMRETDLDSLLGVKVERCEHGHAVGEVCFACATDELGGEVVDIRRARERRQARQAAAERAVKRTVALVGESIIQGAL